MNKMDFDKVKQGVMLLARQIAELDANIQSQKASTESLQVELISASDALTDTIRDHNHQLKQSGGSNEFLIPPLFRIGSLLVDFDDNGNPVITTVPDLST